MNDSLSGKQLQKRRERTIKSLLLLIAIAALALFLRNILIYALITLATGIIVYAINKVKSPYDFSPVFIGSLIVMHHYGIWHVLLFLLLASIIPSMLAGSMIDIVSVLALTSIALISMLSAATGASTPSLFAMIGLYAATVFIINAALSSPGKAAATSAVSIAVNTAYFLLLGRVAL
ncbi:hypothetical protein HYX10_00130 [Candidatus Woesearchaeota archaeon]|nr:hypothetical protein [Candidatus Woesearchaeota archaeon]